MSTDLWFAGIGASLIALSLFTFIRDSHLLRRILAFNIMGSGVFLVMVGLAQHSPPSNSQGSNVDPVPQALVLTGIVVAVAATALALIIFRHFFSASQADTQLDEDKP